MVIRFRHELDAYSKFVSLKLFAHDKDVGNVADDDVLKSLLENWYSSSVSYSMIKEIENKRNER